MSENALLRLGWKYGNPGGVLTMAGTSGSSRRYVSFFFVDFVGFVGFNPRARRKKALVYITQDDRQTVDHVA
jgi:hypothetical protein